VKFAKALVSDRISLYSRRMHERCLKWSPPAAVQALAFAAHALALTARVLACAALILAGGAEAQAAAGEHGYADEDHDWGVAPTNRLRQQPYHGPTPLQIPGAQVVQTRELQVMLAGPDSPILIDVLSEQGHVTLPGALWLSGAGRGANFVDPVQLTLTQLLGQITRGDKARAIVFFCAGSQCWLSYNAALRAVAAGYGKVYWYRGGVEAWMAAGLPTAGTAGADARREPATQ
jgi:PQQ-dependent catabolism-associated CXXCW motif protein